MAYMVEVPWLIWWCKVSLVISLKPKPSWTIPSKGGKNTVLFKDFICEKWWRQNKKSNMIIVHNNTTSIRNRIIPNVYKVDVTSIKIYKLLQRMKNKWFYSHKYDNIAFNMCFYTLSTQHNISRIFFYHLFLQIVNKCNK